MEFRASEDTWLLRPVMEQVLPYTAVFDGSIGLVDIWRLNRELDIRAENERLAAEAMKSK